MEDQHNLEIYKGLARAGGAAGSILITLFFLPLIITAILFASWMAWSMVDARRSWTRIAVALLLPTLLIWCLIGLPGKPEAGLLTATLWAPMEKIILLMQAKYNLVLLRGMRRHGTSPLAVNQLIWCALLAGFLLALLWTYFRRNRRPGRIYRASNRLLDAIAAPIDRAVQRVGEASGTSILQRRVFVLATMAALIGELFYFDSRLVPILRVLAFQILLSLLLIYPCIRKKLPEAETVWVGKDDEEKPFGLGLDQLNHHVHVLGESGFGKSVFLMHILEHHIRNGLGFVFIDLKADRRTMRRLVTLANKAGRLQDMKVFSCANPRFSATYNLCQHGNATEIKDKVIGGFAWSEPYYKKVAEEAVLALTRAFVMRRDSAGTPFTLADLYTCLSAPDCTKLLAANLPANQVDLKNSLNRLATRLRSDKDSHELAGLRADLGLLIQSDFGHLLCSPGKGIDLFRAIQEKKMICISLESLRYGESAIRLGKMILQDLKAVAARIIDEVAEGERKHFTVVIDEFAELASPQFASFIRMARGSKLGIVMAHQEFADLEAVSPEFRDQVVGNAATTVSFLQKNPRSAELVADIAGTHTTTKITRQIDDTLLFRKYTGIQSEREVEEYLIHPSDVKRLRIGECFIVMKYPYAATAKIKVAKLAPVAEPRQLTAQKLPEPPTVFESPHEQKADLSGLF